MNIKATGRPGGRSSSRNVKQRISRHRQPICGRTNLPRYRDRKQAKDAASAKSINSELTAGPYKCAHCNGFHLDFYRTHAATKQDPLPFKQPEPTDISIRRYGLVDIENLTCGARATNEELIRLWKFLYHEHLRLRPSDHVVIGSSRGVARKYKPAIGTQDVRWVLGDNAPDAADAALLCAVNLHQVVRRYDELIIISGDHAFAGLARRARQMGLRVRTVTARQPGQGSTLARELAQACNAHSEIGFEFGRNRQGTSTLRADDLEKVRQIHLVSSAAEGRSALATASR